MGLQVLQPYRIRKLLMEFVLEPWRRLLCQGNQAQEGKRYLSEVCICSLLSFQDPWTCWPRSERMLQHFQSFSMNTDLTGPIARLAALPYSPARQVPIADAAHVTSTQGLVTVQHHRQMEELHDGPAYHTFKLFKNRWSVCANLSTIRAAIVAAIAQWVACILPGIPQMPAPIVEGTDSASTARVKTLALCSRWLGQLLAAKIGPCKSSELQQLTIHPAWGV